MQANTSKYQTYVTKDGQHFLPPIEQLQPISNTNAGVFEQWPGQSAGTTVGNETIVMTRDKRMHVVTTENRRDAVQKPKFLMRLEQYLNEELKALGVADQKPNELRLQVYREVFEYLIEDFRTYRPILASIKNEYEMMLCHLRDRIRDLEPLRQLLATVSEQADQRIMELQNQEKQDVLNLQKENRHLMETIQQMKDEEVNYQTQIDRLQEEVAKEYQRYRDECDARKLLIGDINDLRSQQEQQAAEQAAANKEAALKSEGIENDPQLMKIALENARKAERIATTELNRIEAEYQDVVPRRDFEILTKNHEELAEIHTRLKTESDNLRKEHEVLLGISGQYKETCKKTEEELELLKRTATPRPAWEKCAGVVYGGATRWTELTDNGAKRSDEMVDVLLEEIKKGGGSAGDNSDDVETFPLLGNDSETPAYLRYLTNTGDDVKIVNRRLAKRDVLITINDFWIERNYLTPPERHAKALDEHFAEFLESRFPKKFMAVEWGFNIHQACQRYYDDDQIRLFMGCLVGGYDEEIFHREANLIKALKEKLGGDSFSTASVPFAMADILPGMNEEELDKLDKVANEIAADGMIRSNELLSIGADGRRSTFLNELHLLLTNDHMDFVSEIMKSLQAESISPDALREAIQTVDTEMSANHIDYYLSWVFQCSTSELAETAPLPKDDVDERLQHSSIYQTGR